MEDGSVRVLLALAFPLERSVLSNIIEVHPDYQLAGETSDANAAVDLATRTKPDIIVIDDSLADMGIVALAHFLSLRRPQASILLCCSATNEKFLAETIREGVRGFISRTRLAEDFVKALDALSDNRPYWDEVVSEEAFTALMGAPATNDCVLTEREKQVLTLVAEGHRSDEIAHTLRLDRKTVETHRLNLRRKLKLRTVSDVVRYAIEHGFARA